MVIGEGGVGKTNFVGRLMGREFGRKYVATNAYELHHLAVNTNQGVVNFELWDTAGQEKPGGLRDAYYENLHAAILMFDLQSRVTYKEMSKWYSDICRFNSHVPFVLIANKTDGEIKVKEKFITLHKKKTNMSYVRMSVKIDPMSSLFEPLLCVVEKLKGLEPGTLHLV